MATVTIPNRRPFARAKGCLVLHPRQPANFRMYTASSSYTPIALSDPRKLLSLPSEKPLFPLRILEAIERGNLDESLDFLART